jgi:hypothetical protein
MGPWWFFWDGFSAEGVSIPAIAFCFCELDAFAPGIVASDAFCPGFDEGDGYSPGLVSGDGGCC